MRLTGKLSLAFASVALLASVAGVYLATTINTVKAHYTTALTLSAGNTAAKDIQYGIASQQSAGRGRNLYKDITLVDVFNNFNKYTNQKIDGLITTLNGTPVDASVKADVQALKQENATYAAVVNKSFSLAAQGNIDAGAAVGAKEAAPVAARMDKLAIAISTALDTAAANQQAAVATQVAQMQMIGYSVVVAGLALGVIIGLILARSISRPIQQVARNAQRLGSGDLTVEALKINSRDEVGEMANAFNGMAANLRSLLQGIAANAQTVMASSEQLSASADQAAQAAQGMAQAVGEVAAGASEQSRQDRKSVV